MSRPRDELCNCLICGRKTASRKCRKCSANECYTTGFDMDYCNCSNCTERREHKKGGVK